MKKMQDVDDLSIEFLEQTAPRTSSDSVKIDVLPEAVAHHIDLDGLEKMTSPVNVTVDVQASVVSQNNAADVSFSHVLDDADVPLRDMAYKIFNQSERAFVVVRDDCVEYANKAFLNLLNITDINNVIHEKFLKFVVREDWDYLAENIGRLLMNNEEMSIRLSGEKHKISKVKFKAIYLSDSQHFTFILIGEPPAVKITTAAMMYHPITGLPNFYLFEDRVQMAVNHENYKDKHKIHHLIAVIGVAIDDFASLKNVGLHELVLKKLAERLVLSLHKTYSVASGVRYQFWILIPDLENVEALEPELEHIRDIFAEPVADNFTLHDISVSLGVSLYPEPASSAKKLVEQAIAALQAAQKSGGKTTRIFNG